MNLKLLSLGCLIAFSMGQVSAEKTYKYRVNLKDKEGTAFSIDKPQKFLSERALERRNRQNIQIDEADLPVSKDYVKKLLKTGARLQESNSIRISLLLQERFSVTAAVWWR
mgnify:FL=1